MLILNLSLRIKIKPKIKGGGQECPPYHPDQIDFTGIAITSSTKPTSFCTNGSA